MFLFFSLFSYLLPRSYKQHSFFKAQNSFLSIFFSLSHFLALTPRSLIFSSCSSIYTSGKAFRTSPGWWLDKSFGMNPNHKYELFLGTCTIELSTLAFFCRCFKDIFDKRMGGVKRGDVKEMRGGVLEVL
jgi:hypothetical protein